MNRSRLRRVLALALGLVCAFGSAVSCAGGRGSAGSQGPAVRLSVYVGTYTDSGSRGIYRFEMDPATGAASDPVLAGESENPSFLALYPGGRILYAVNEVAGPGPDPTGAVSAFAIDPNTGGLTPIAKQTSGGADPCHVAVDRAGRNALVANYNGGNVTVLPLDSGGRLQPATAIRAHEGRGPDPLRQKGPHAHQIVLDPAERFALAADLGIDRIVIYGFNGDAGSLTDGPEAVPLPPGSGPRHLVFHPSGGYVYVINELSSAIAAFRFDARRASLEPIQTIATIPAAFSGQNTAAEVAVSPDGRFLYASNRGDDSLAVFAIDPGTGRLAPSDRVACGGRTPRHFAIDPSGRWLLVANQNSDSIAIFQLDRATGHPDQVGGSLRVSKPACVVFAPPPR